jgi:hypothetical protein
MWPTLGHREISDTMSRNGMSSVFVAAFTDTFVRTIGDREAHSEQYGRLWQRTTASDIIF